MEIFFIFFKAGIQDRILQLGIDGQL